MRRWPVVLPGPLVAALLATAASAQSSQQAIVIDAAYSHVDYQTNTVLFEHVVVSQGDTRITAERAHATGVGFANSLWTFEGQVLIALQPRGTVRADQAVVQFRDDRIIQATAHGRPAQFEQQRAGAELAQRRGASDGAAHGEADQIVYDAQDDSVRLSGSAQLFDGRQVEISAPTLVYEIRDERLRAASPDESRGVHVVVTSRPVPKRGKPPAGRAPRRRPPA